MNILEFHTELFPLDPVITEFSAFQALRRHPFSTTRSYLAVPWAVLINRNQLEQAEALPETPNSFTVCQHVQYAKILPLLVRKKISVLFTPHVEQDHSEVRILPFPHFPVNGTGPAPVKDIPYSFIGIDSTAGVPPGVRRKLFTMRHAKGAVIVERKVWHWARENQWGELSPAEQEREKREYQDTLARSRFSLCPRGFGASTIRFWESLQAGAIPILLADAMRLPAGFDWKTCVIRIPEKDAEKLPQILARITPEEEKLLRENALAAHARFSGERFTETINEALA